MSLTREKHIAVFQHIPVEHPGIFRDFLAADGIRWHAFELDAGDAIPVLDAFDALWVMGGPMDVWEEEAYPWLKAEKNAIKYAVAELKLPFLGVCLGHQLLADVLGGRVSKAQQSEIGVCEVTLAPTASAHELFNGLRSPLSCLQWHAAEVAVIPTNAEVLASSDLCAVQAMSYGSHAYSTQFHVEVTESTVEEWSKVPEYMQSLRASLGEGALDSFVSDVLQRMDAFNRSAKCLYENWKLDTNFI